MKKEWNEAVIEELGVNFTAHCPTLKEQTWDGIYWDDEINLWCLNDGETPSGNSIQIPTQLNG